MRKTENIINRTGINKTECKKNGHSKENKIPGVKCTPKIELYLSNFRGALHWWNGSLFFLIIILGITLGIFAGCKNIFVPEPPATPEAAGPGGGITVSLRLFTGSARSVMPGMKALTWKITASQGDITISVEDGAYPEFSLSLPVSGTWTFTVRGINSANDEIFTGSAEQNIESGSTVSISIPLSPGNGMIDSGATGDLNLTIKPENVCVMLLSYRIDNGAWSHLSLRSEASMGGGGTIYYPYEISEELSVGQHTLDLYFDGGSGFYFCTVAVNIWPGMTSDQWIKTSGEEYINDKGDFVITGDMVNEFVKNMGSVVFVDSSVVANTPGTGSIYAPVNSVSKAVDILRQANKGSSQINGTIMVSGATTIEDEIDVNFGETLTIKGTRENASITNTSGRVFNIASGGSLTLEENITLTGTVTNDNGGAVYVNGGSFTMKNGSKITRSSASYGGGVYVDSEGTFTMGGGAITENSASIDETGTGGSGGGVCISDGTFTMSGTATLQGNTATEHGGGVRILSGGTFSMKGGSKITGGEAAFGGGVYVADGSFTMSGTATLQGNKATEHGGGVHILSGGTFTMNGGTIGGDDANTATYGGGVFVSSGKFNMNDGTISGNSASGTGASGGGVFVSGGEFTMSGGAVISGNTAASSGGGVFVHDGTFKMEGSAVIQGNKATSTDSQACGGGVYVNGGEFTMNGGTIGGATANTATQNGGGVYVAGGTFTMNDGTIGGIGVVGTDVFNNANVSGGGVYVGDGIFTMNGGSIQGNESISGNGGGIYLDGTNAKVTLNNTSSISGNVAAGSGYGVYVGDGTFTLSGSPNISGNYLFDVNNTNNVYLTNGNTITIGDGGLTGGTIGVTAENVPSGTAVQITNGDVPGADGIFSSDNLDYSIVKYNGAVYLSDAETKYVTDSGTKNLDTFEAALAAVNGSGGTITLLKDIGGTNAVFGANSANDQPITFTGGMESNPVILDLNGHTINRALEMAQEDGTVISVSGALTLEDSTGSGKITGGNNNNSTTSGTWGGGVCVQGGAFFTMKGGNISCNLSEIGGGGVYVCKGGSFTMTGGTIGGSDANDANMDKSTSSSGGGVFVNGEFTMSGGTITGNTTDANGGGVAVTADGTFTMSGTAVISANKALSGSGGGVYVFGNFTMTGGTIGGTEPNTAVLGGGVYVGTDNFTLGPSSTGSSPVISGNKETGNSPNNVYLDNTYLVIGGKLAEASGNVGITMATPGVFTSGWSTSGSTEPTFFFSDDTKRTVALSGSELSLNLVFVQGGSCELNSQSVTLSDFWISPYEVTQAEFESIMTGNQNGITPDFYHKDDILESGEDQKRRPADRVRWYEAIVYCNLLSIKEGLTPCYTINDSTDPDAWGVRPDSGAHDNYNVWNSVTCNFDANGYRLPTEAEWEYAARGGNPKDSSWNYDYSGSDTLEDVAWYSSNSESKTHEVGKKQFNALGLYDMSGNVWEWCWNRKSDDYPGSGENPTGPGEDTPGGSRQLRGGCYNTDMNNSKISSRNSNYPTSQGSNYGFRVVRSIR